ncbi:hypothetical protein D9M71_709110 [compost metagenome]
MPGDDRYFDAGLKQEIEFETKLRALLAKHGYSLKDVVNLLDPQAGRRTPAAQSQSGTRKPRQVKILKILTLAKSSKPKAENH